MNVPPSSDVVFGGVAVDAHCPWIKRVIVHLVREPQQDRLAIASHAARPAVDIRVEPTGQDAIAQRPAGVWLADPAPRPWLPGDHSYGPMRGNSVAVWEVERALPTTPLRVPVDDRHGSAELLLVLVQL